MRKLILPNLMFIYGLLAVGIPLSRVEIGPMPLYFIDIVAFLVLVLGRNHIGVMFRRHRRISGVILIFILTLLPTTLSEYMRMSPLEPTYLLGRTLLHILAVWSISGFLRNELYMSRFLTGLACGILITASVASLNSIPTTGPWVRAHVFTIPWLFPQAADDSLSSEMLMNLDKGEAERGNSLLGKSNITGCVIISMLPFLIGVVRKTRPAKTTRLIFNAAIIAAFFALIFTYSRSIYLAVAIMLSGYLIFEREAFSKRFLPLIILAVIVIGAVGMQSTFFKFDFVADKFDLDNERYTHTNSARILAYTYPFKVVYNDPTYFFRGAGRAFKKLRERDPDANILELDAQMHSVFAASVFYRGVLAMLALFYLYFLLMKTSYKNIKMTNRTKNSAGWMAIASMISLMSIIPPWLFTHFFVSKPSGHIHLFIIVALIISSLEQIRLKSEKSPEAPTEVKHKNKRLLNRVSHA